MKYVATVSYLGQGYSGFQRQRNGLKSIQGELERALSFALGVETQIKGAGRTDAGVNALGQRVSFVSERPLDENFINLWNHLLPLDIQVTKIDTCPDSFDARHSSIGKVYEYRFAIKGRNPFEVGRLTQLEAERFDKTLFEKSLRCFEGEHDFRCFTTKPQDKDNFVRVVEPIQILWSEDGNIGRIVLKSNGFMTYQIRLMMGVAFKIAMGRLPESKIPELLSSKTRKIASFKAAPDGLYLVEVLYE